MKKLISMPKSHNEGQDSVCYIKTKNFDIKVRATFSLHVLIERLWNEVKEIPAEKRRPLDMLLYQVIENNFSMPVQEISYIIQKLFNDINQPTDKPLEISDVRKTTTSFLYCVALLIGGGEAGKKLLALQAMRRLQIKDLMPKNLKSLSRVVIH